MINSVMSNCAPCSLSGGSLLSLHRTGEMVSCLLMSGSGRCLEDNFLCLSIDLSLNTHTHQ